MSTISEKTSNNNQMTFDGVSSNLSENEFGFGIGYVKNINGSSRAGAGGVAKYTDAFGNTVKLGTFTAFSAGATDEEKDEYYASLNRIIFRYKWM